MVVRITVYLLFLKVFAGRDERGPHIIPIRV